MRKWPTVSIIIPAYKCQTLPTYLIKSLNLINYPSSKIEIIVVGILSPVKISKTRIRHIFISKKIGYGEAANIGIKNAKGQYIFLINPDIKFEKLMLEHLLSFIMGDKKIAIVGPKVYSLLRPNKISGFDLPVLQFNRSLGVIKSISSKNLSKLKNSLEVEWISGSAMMFKKSLWKKLKGFDKQFFLYWEDADFCIRAKKLGLKIILLPQAQMWHQGSASVGADNPLKYYYLKRNSMIFLKKHAGFNGLLIESIRTAVLVLAKILRFIFQQHKREESYMYLLGILDFYRGKTASLDKL